MHKVIVFICCFIFLFGMFWFFTWMKSKAIKNMFRYPQTTNCKTVTSIFTPEGGATDTTLYAEYASIDKDLT